MSETCVARQCKRKAASDAPMCAFHWFQVPPRVRSQIRINTVPLTTAILHVEKLEAAEKRQELIDEAGGL